MPVKAPSKEGFHELEAERPLVDVSDAAFANIWLIKALSEPSHEYLPQTPVLAPVQTNSLDGFVRQLDFLRIFKQKKPYCLKLCCCVNVAGWYRYELHLSINVMYEYSKSWLRCGTNTYLHVCYKLATFKGPVL